MQVIRPVHTVERRIVGAAGRKHAENKANGVWRVVRPRASRHDVMRVDVENELACPVERLLAGLFVG
jgi:hypothetical protein